MMSRTFIECIDDAGDPHSITRLAPLVPSRQRGERPEPLPATRYELGDGRPVQFAGEGEADGWIHPDTGAVLRDRARNG